MANKKENKSRKGFLSHSFICMFVVIFGAIIITVIPIVSAAWDTSDVNFEIRFSETTCSANGDRWLEPDGTSESSLNNCRINVNGAEKTCCPLGYNCEQSAGQWNCVANSTFTCFDYKTQTSCSGYAPSVADNSVYRATGKYCNRDVDYRFVAGIECADIFMNCKCEWSSSASRCDAKYNINRSCENGTSSILGACAFSDGGSTPCENDVISLKWLASWSGADTDRGECINGTKDIPCKPTVRLDFFTPANIIMAIALIVIIYIIYYFMERRGEAKKARKKLKK